MTTTTSLKLPNALKEQIAITAAREGKTAHALMVDTLQTAMDDAALRQQLLMGLAIGNIAPVLFTKGAEAEPDAPGHGIAAVTTLGYAGFLVGPPMIGFLASVTSLTIALLVLALGAAAVSLAAPLARRQR